jgi:hypothetical protein
MAADNVELLRSAMEREAPAVLTAGEGPARRQVMVQFAKGRPNNSPEIWAYFHEADGRIIDRLIESGGPVGLWFQNEASMVLFESTLVKKRKALTRKLLLLSWPQNISIVEERHQPRRLVPESFQISARLQVLTPNREVEHEIHARIWDIGLEGASLICPFQHSLISLVKDAWLKVVLRVRDAQHEYGFPALFRHMSHVSDETLRLGLQFIPSGDPSAASANAALAALVNELNQLCGGNSAATANSAARSDRTTSN